MAQKLTHAEHTPSDGGYGNPGSNALCVTEAELRDLCNDNEACNAYEYKEAAGAGYLGTADCNVDAIATDGWEAWALYLFVDIPSWSPLCACAALNDWIRNSLR